MSCNLLFVIVFKINLFIVKYFVFIGITFRCDTARESTTNLYLLDGKDVSVLVGGRWSVRDPANVCLTPTTWNYYFHFTLKGQEILQNNNASSAALHE